ncbi:MAG TPA: EAL domain-containing protein [Gallionella sp.]|nr:EAL domain-containing protein [Gallionella sp.]
MFDELDREVFAAGEQIFKEGDAGDCAYLIEKGSVEVIVMGQGAERQVSLLGKDEMFGEVALIDHQPRTATIRAVEKTVLVPIRRKLVEELLKKSDPILRHLLLVILERFRNKQDNLTKPAVSAEASLEQSSRRIALKGEATQKLSLAHGITRALARGEFELYYQPVCNLADDSIAGFEALIRWHHPTDGVIQPMDFLWLVEQIGLVRELGLWTLERACHDWSTLRQYSSYEFPFISVNLSPSQLTCESLVDDIKAIIERHNVPATELKLELTETVIIEHPELALKILNKLIELGSGLALDDYGTGHSGLNHLQRYPIGTLKIDRSFIAPMLESGQSHEIVRSSVALAHSLGMNVIAEGVEAKEVGARLLEMGCDFGQGWHYGRPAALQELVMRHAITPQQQL